MYLELELRGDTGMDLAPPPLVVVRVVEVASVDRGQGRVVVRLQEKIKSSPIQSVGSCVFVETVVKVFVVNMYFSFLNLENTPADVVEPPLVDRRSRRGRRRDADPRLALPLLPPPGAGHVGRMVRRQGTSSGFSGSE